jgi:hypothetical protein
LGGATWRGSLVAARWGGFRSAGTTEYAT